MGYINDIYLEMLAVVFSFYIFLMITEKKKYISDLSAGFACYIIMVSMYVFKDFFISVLNENLFLIILKSAFFCAPFLILHAINQFAKKQEHKVWQILILITVFWISISHYTNLTFNLQIIPLAIINGIVFIYTAYLIYDYEDISIGIKILCASIFLISSVLFFIVPVFRNEDAFIFIEQVINSTILIILAIMVSMIMFYFQNIRYNLVQKQKQIDYMNLHDELTGLYNRNYYDTIKKELQNKENYPLSFVIADATGLTLLNDSLGRSLGDILLIETSKLIQKIKKENELVFRWGGDEILIVMKKTDFVTAKERVEEFKDIISGDSLKEIPVSIAFGISTKSKNTKSLDVLIEEAENSMYVNKLIHHKDFRKSLVSYFSNKIHQKEGKTPERLSFIKRSAVNVGYRMGISEDDIDILEKLSMLYDVGKIIIPFEILEKKSELTNKDWELIKKYPELSHQIISSAYEGSKLAQAVYSIRERWNGKGYPRGLYGDKIPVTARIISVIEGFDAMTNSIFRDKKTKREALVEIKKNASVQFDPKVVEVFLKMMSEKYDIIIKDEDVDNN